MLNVTSWKSGSQEVTDIKSVFLFKKGNYCTLVLDNKQQFHCQYITCFTQLVGQLSTTMPSWPSVTMTMAMMTELAMRTPVTKQKA